MENTRIVKSGDRLINYQPTPNAVVGKLTSTTQMIYSMLLSRVMLSARNNWIDEEGNVFITYTIKSLAKDINKSESVIKRGLNALEREHLLIRKKAGFNKPNRLYLLVPIESLDGAQDSKTVPKGTIQGQKSTLEYQKGTFIGGSYDTTYRSKTNNAYGRNCTTNNYSKNNRTNNLKEKYKE